MSKKQLSNLLERNIEKVRNSITQENKRIDIKINQYYKSSLKLPQFNKDHFYFMNAAITEIFRYDVDTVGNYTNKVLDFNTLSLEKFIKESILNITFNNHFILTLLDTLPRTVIQGGNFRKHLQYHLNVKNDNSASKNQNNLKYISFLPYLGIYSIGHLLYQYYNTNSDSNKKILYDLMKKIYIPIQWQNDFQDTTNNFFILKLFFKYNPIKHTYSIAEMIDCGLITQHDLILDEKYDLEPFYEFIEPFNQTHNIFYFNIHFKCFNFDESNQNYKDAVAFSDYHYKENNMIKAIDKDTIIKNGVLEKTLIEKVINSECSIEIQIIYQFGAMFLDALHYSLIKNRKDKEEIFGSVTFMLDNLGIKIKNFFKFNILLLYDEYHSYYEELLSNTQKELNENSIYIMPNVFYRNRKQESINGFKIYSDYLYSMHISLSKNESNVNYHEKLVSCKKYIENVRFMIKKINKKSNLDCKLYQNQIEIHRNIAVFPDFKDTSLRNFLHSDFHKIFNEDLIDDENYNKFITILDGLIDIYKKNLHHITNYIRIDKSTNCHIMGDTIKPYKQLSLINVRIEKILINPIFIGKVEQLINKHRGYK